MNVKTTIAAPAWTILERVSGIPISVDIVYASWS